ncbi:hypothetical protein KQI68_07985 [Peptoniphilus sp. MSJ-1]|uniref:Uncharacterized protein n=1 Tax=Peptoniphilus ovalis TaxID=2841503 RepID=A0ABS6FHX1_9FIRM|nr:hypothetical protein [Peptoniphilus ovalis]MBU5669773.1 hypothetical protein [Peptoniphilus ovalis]
MNISKEEFEEIIKLAILQISKNKRINFIFSKPWNNKYYFALDIIKNLKINANCIISNELSDYHKNIISNYLIWNEVINLNDDNLDLISENDTFFLDIKLKNIINVILFDEEEYESRLVMKLFEKGNSVYLWKETVKKVTGKEPKNYINKLLGYYDEILSYGVKIVDIEEVNKYE